MSRARHGDPELGARLRAFRRRLKLSQRQLAAALGINAPQISSWENGFYGPANRRLKDLAALGLDLHWAFTGVGEMCRPLQPIQQDYQG